MGAQLLGVRCRLAVPHANADKRGRIGELRGSGGVEEAASTVVAKMDGHVIVLGYELLGIYVVEKLKKMGLPHVVVVRDETKLALLEKSNVPALGSPIARSFQTLKTAGASRASAIIATYDDDGDNLLSILNAKKINPGLRAIAVVNDRDMVEAAEASGADVVLAPYELTGQLLALSTVSKGVSAIFVKGSFKSNHISEFVVDGEGKGTYQDLNRIAPVVMVSRDGKTTMNPEDSFGLERGDTIYAMTDGHSLVALEQELLRKRMISSREDGSPEKGKRRLARSGGRGPARSSARASVLSSGTCLNSRSETRGLQSRWG
ncbi:MAG: potassium channel family protein [Nitrososphaerales archaeon]